MPDSYEVDRHTLLGVVDEDPLFDDSELEWHTVQRGSIIIYGLLIRQEDMPLDLYPFSN